MALNGNNGDDSFHGTIFDDEIFGFGGDDYVHGSPGADRIDGGSDSDRVDYSHFHGGVVLNTIFIDGDVVDVDLQRAVQFGGLAEGDVLIDIEEIFGSAYNDTIRGDGEDNVLGGFAGKDIIDGRGGDDLLQGEDGNDQLTGGSGDDDMSGGADNDTLFGDQGADRLDGGAGVDTANYASSASGVSVNLAAGTGTAGDAAGDVLVGIENVIGSALGDTLTGSAGANVLTGGIGNDTLAGLAGGDTLVGGAGFDTATYAASVAGVTVDLALGTGAGGHAADDTLVAVENLIGSRFADALFGNAAGNLLDGGADADVLAGRLGNDIYVVDDARDAVSEAVGEGLDEVRTGVSFKLTGGAEVETLRTIDDNGTAAINLSGNEFANLIVGNTGNNALSGGGGDDTLIGLRGVDRLTGGLGGDTFVWRDAGESGTVVAAMDLVVDFDPLAGDLMDLSGIDADVFTAGNQTFTFIGAAGFSGTPGEINFVQVNGETIIQIQTGVVTDVEMGIRIAGLVTPEASWFVL